MRYGVTMFMTDLTMGPAELARAVEARGLHSLYVPEHTHIPTSRRTPPPTGDAELRDEYKRTLDPFVALTMAAAATERLVVGTGICLIAQREPIVTAKAVATLDHLSGGRFVLGIGFGWNADELEDHGVTMPDRRAVVRERMLAMRALWDNDVASYDGEFVHIPPAWSWPKPVHAGGPPVLIGGAAGPKLFAHVAEYADGWIPIGGGGVRAVLPDLHRACEAVGRDPATLHIVPFGTLPDAGKLEYYESIGVTEVVLRLPSGRADRVLPILDEYAPDPDTPLLADALTGMGHAVDVRDWRDPAVDWSGASVTVLRSPWDYVDHLDEFLEWAARVDAVSALWNPLALVRWNTHKSYLLDLRSRGAPIVPTVVLLGGSAASLDGICDAQGWNAVVVKPAVASGSRGARRADVGDADAQAHLDDLLEQGEVLVQQFVPGIAEEGEWSVVLVDGVVSHGLRKRPAYGDYRVQEEWGGTTQRAEPSPSLAELATRVYDALPAPALYARIDIVSIAGHWHVMEVEATEPSLWLDLAPETTRRLADAIHARVSPNRA